MCHLGLQMFDLHSMQLEAHSNFEVEDLKVDLQFPVPQYSEQLLKHLEAGQAPVCVLQLDTVVLREVIYEAAPDSVALHFAAPIPIAPKLTVPDFADLDSAPGHTEN